MDIKVLGPGCKKCNDAEKVVREAVSESSSDAVVEHVTDLLEIARYRVFSTPAVVVDGKVVCSGKVPRKDEVLRWIKKEAD